jgi:NTP pyrophosphatase (non-canonical NTP hydrolase)
MSLTNDEYQEFVEWLASEKSKESFDARLNLVGLGLGGEAGEVTDYCKKVLFHDVPLNQQKLISEMGDVMWYIAFACNTLGIKLQDVIDANVEKLRDRYPTGKFRVEDCLRKEGLKTD